MANEAVGPEELMECLNRSGYLLESRIVRELDDRGYFVEPSQVLQDLRTGKSREIDFVAEHHSYVAEHSGLCVKTYFVGEVVNNRFPIVLLTPRPSSPNSDFESYVKFGCTPGGTAGVPPFYDALNIYDERSPPSESLFAQYCALTMKKGDQRELMASHPEDLYGSLRKLAEYVEQELHGFDDWGAESESNIWRVFFWHPMLVVGGQLFTVTMDDPANPTAREVHSAFLELNWHEGEDRKTTVVEVVQVGALYERMAEIVAWDAATEAKLHEVRKRSKSDDDGPGLPADGGRSAAT